MGLLMFFFASLFLNREFMGWCLVSSKRAPLALPKWFYASTLEESSMCKHFQRSLGFSRKTYKNCLFMQIKVCSPLVSVKNSVPKCVRVCGLRGSQIVVVVVWNVCQRPEYIHIPIIHTDRAECASLTISWNRNLTKFQFNYELINNMYKKFHVVSFFSIVP